MSAEQIIHLQGDWKRKVTSDLALYSGLVGPTKAEQIPESKLNAVDLKHSDAMRDKSFQLPIDAANDLYLDCFGRREQFAFPEFLPVTGFWQKSIGYIFNPANVVLASPALFPDYVRHFYYPAQEV